MADAGTLTLDRVLEPATAPAALTGPPPVAASGSSRWVVGAAALIVMAGAAIRFAALSTSIWFDESVTVKDVNGSFGQMLHRVVNHEASPPFYFVCLWIWRHLVGDTGADLRALSALAGTLTIALAFYVARRRIGPRAGLILAACVAVSPVLVYYSTEMRMYGVLVLITGVGFEAFLCASKSPNRRNLSVWATVSLLALWTQYYAVLAVAPQAAWLITLAWKHRSRSRCTLIAVGALALPALPLVYLLPYQAHRAFPYGSQLLSSAWQRGVLSLHSMRLWVRSLRLWRLARAASHLLASPCWSAWLRSPRSCSRCFVVGPAGVSSFSASGSPGRPSSPLRRSSPPMLRSGAGICCRCGCRSASR
jgi:hypothetical protein